MKQQQHHRDQNNIKSYSKIIINIIQLWPLNVVTHNAVVLLMSCRSSSEVEVGVITETVKFKAKLKVMLHGCSRMVNHVCFHGRCFKGTTMDSDLKVHERGIFHLGGMVVGGGDGKRILLGWR